jgi:hypothetical protein
MKPLDTSGLSPEQWRELLELAEQAQDIPAESHPHWLADLGLDAPIRKMLLSRH